MLEELSRQVQDLEAELHEMEIESDLLDGYIEEGDADDPARPSNEALERDLDALFDEMEVLEAALAEAMKAWSLLVLRKLGIET